MYSHVQPRYLPRSTSSPVWKAGYSVQSCGDSAEVVEIEDKSGDVSFTGNGDWSNVEVANLKRKTRQKKDATASSD